jgi:hypothetical protein
MSNLVNDNRYLSIRVGGAPSCYSLDLQLSGKSIMTIDPSIALYDPRQLCYYVYATPGSTPLGLAKLPQTSGGETQTMSKFLWAALNPSGTTDATGSAIMIPYQAASPVITSEAYWAGVSALAEGVNTYTICRREFVGTKTAPTYVGAWSPVVVNTSKTSVNDFSVTSGRSYQYIIYPSYSLGSANRQRFANAVDFSVAESRSYGDPVATEWGFWCLAPLTPIQKTESTASYSKIYEVDSSNLWFFKYDADVGEQTQNVAKSEQQTLGRYPRVGHGLLNAISGSVSCYMGSEITCGSGIYTERMPISRISRLSSNERAEMLRRWRKLVYDKNPKLLRDKKGQLWIVQIMSGTNSPQTHIPLDPDKISFSWKEIADSEGAVIYGDPAPEISCLNGMQQSEGV